MKSGFSGLRHFNQHQVRFGSQLVKNGPKHFEHQLAQL